MEIEEQQKRISEMEARHAKELEQIREAGHETLKVIVEEYKAQIQLAISQERERGEGLLQEAISREQETAQQKIQEQHERYVHVHVQYITYINSFD